MVNKMSGQGGYNSILDDIVDKYQEILCLDDGDIVDGDENYLLLHELNNRIEWVAKRFFKPSSEVKDHLVDFAIKKTILDRENFIMETKHYNEYGELDSDLPGD